MSTEYLFLETLEIPPEYINSLYHVLGLNSPLPVADGNYDSSSNIVLGKCTLYGIEDLDIEIKIAPSTDLALEVNLSKSGEAFSVESLSWLLFSDIQFQLFVFNDLAQSPSGTLSAGTTLPVLTLSGILIQEDVDDIAGTSSQYVWKILSQGLQNLSVDGVLTDLAGDTAVILAEVQGLVASIVDKIELILRPDSYALGLQTPFSWTIVNNLKIEDIVLYLSTSYYSITDNESQILLQGALKSGEGQGFLIAVKFTKIPEYISYQLSIHSLNDQGLSIQDILGDSTVSEHIAWLPSSWEDKINNTSLKTLDIDYIPSIGNFRLATDGVFLGIETFLQFSLQKFLGNTYFSFNARLFYEPAAIEQVMVDTLSLDISDDVSALIPAIKIGINDIGFDQLASSFQLAGTIELGKSNPVSALYSLNLVWINGLEFDFAITFYDSGLSLSRIASSLDLDFATINQFLPQKMSDHVLATSFLDLSLGIDTPNKLFRFAGRALIFGSWDTSIAFQSYTVDSTRYLSFDAEIKDVDIDFKKIPETLGFAEGTESWLEIIPDIAISPTSLSLDQESQSFSIACGFRFSESIVSTSLAVTRNDAGGRVIGFSFVSDPDYPLSLINLFKAVLPFITIWNKLPNLNLFIEQLNFKTDGSAGKTQITGNVIAYLLISESRLNLTAVSAEENENSWQFQGSSLADQNLPIGELIEWLADKFGSIELPEVLAGLTLSNLQISFNTFTKDFYFLCETEFTLDDKPAQLILSIDIVNTTQDYRKTFSGLLILGPRQFSVLFESTTTKTSLIAAFENQQGEEINLVNDLVGLISDSTALNLPDDDLNLTRLKLYLIQLSYEKDKSTQISAYGIKGEFDWLPGLGLSSDPSETFQVRCSVDLTKQSGAGKKVLGTICGTLDAPVDGLEFLSLGVCYKIVSAAQQELALQLTVGKVLFEAVYRKTNGDIALDFGVNVGDSLTLKEVATFFVSLVDPSVDEYEFDPPWHVLGRINLASFLNSVKLVLNIKKNTVSKKSETSLGIAFTDLDSLLPGELKPFISIKRFELSYESVPASGAKPRKQVLVKIQGKFLGQDRGADNPLSWDPINEAAPEIPGQGVSVFELRYLGLGQHVAFTQAAQVSSIKEVMDLLSGAIEERESELKNDRSLTLRNPLETFGDGGAIAFSPESEWLIGVDVSLLKVLDLTIIFNDPVIYGLRIELSGKTAGNFAGLQFEILYQRISDSIGKYHVDLTLPDIFRYFQVGAVSVTLPLIVVDIFTNGDFKVDLGFPWEFNFARSFAIEVFPFTGAGGFYFNKLSAATATLVPTLKPGQSLKPVEQGVFNPIYEFGLGLRIGLGKSFRSGPLNAEISITVQGIIEGVVSWYMPIEPDSERELYFKIAGGVAIVGRLYGEVDFEIISVSIEVIASARIVFVVEVYQPVQLALIADVSVKASVKVAFVKVSFSFNMTVEQEFTIPSPQGDALPPWVQ